MAVRPNPFDLSDDFLANLVHLAVRAKTAAADDFALIRRTLAVLEQGEPATASHVAEGFRLLNQLAIKDAVYDARTHSSSSE